MEMVDVTSSQLAQVGYDPATCVLAVRFRSGGLYHYRNVPPEKHAVLMGSDSMGSYFHRHIRALHESERIQEPAVPGAASPTTKEQP